MDGACPLCGKEIRKPKMLYGHTVCKKCWAGFINRRQVAYMVDGLLGWGCVGLATSFMAPLTLSDGLAPAEFALALLGVRAGIYGCWLVRDGLGGAFAGKRLFGLRVVNNDTSEPISFLPAFKRYAPFGALALAACLAQAGMLLSIIAERPAIGRFLAIAVLVFSLLLIVLIIIWAFQINKGPRWGDGWANSRVIWLRYANNAVFNPTVAPAASPSAFAPAFAGAVDEGVNDPYRAPRA